MLHEIVNRIPHDILPPAQKQVLLEALAHNTPAYSFRLNTAKYSADLNLPPVSWCSNAWYLPHKPQFSMDPLWHAGAYYVQEAGSMFLHAVINALPGSFSPQLAIDLCAAPGGKTTLLSTLLPNNCLLIANEITSKRLGSLYENVVKWGDSRIAVAHNAPADFAKLGPVADLILVDAPCSGEGLLRRTNEALNQWSEKLVEECCYRQKQILESALACLKPGGYLVYSTCTYNILENEENLDWLINRQNCLPVNLNIGVPGGVTVTETAGNKAYRFFPGITRSEGFFITVVQKNEDTGSHIRKPKPAKYKAVANPAPQFIQLQPGHMLVQEKDTLKLVNAATFDMLESIRGKLHITYMGNPLGEVKNGKFVPHELLSFSTAVHTRKTTPVNYETAVNYVARNNMQVQDIETGFGFICFEGVRLGLVNILPNRVNNYFPQNWRLLKPDKDNAFCITQFK